jgi:hypothetical protein
MNADPDLKKVKAAHKKVGHYLTYCPAKYGSFGSKLLASGNYLYLRFSMLF